jgi:hypothetical protein
MEDEEEEEPSFCHLSENFQEKKHKMICFEILRKNMPPPSFGCLLCPIVSKKLANNILK